MSEFLTKIDQPFSEAITSQQVLEALQTEGAILLRGFVPSTEQSAIIHEVSSYELTEVDNANHTIPEQFRDIGWTFNDSPDRVKRLGQRISQLVRPTIPAWFTNHVRAQLYSPGEVGIEWHRDYTRDLRVVAVASFLGSSLFQIKLDSGQVDWELQPGDLTLMRGTLLTGTVDDRPSHRVEAPKHGARLSVAYRQVVEKPVKLEPKNVRD